MREADQVSFHTPRGAGVLNALTRSGNADEFGSQVVV